MLALGDGVVYCGSYAQRCSTTSTSSSTHTSHAASHSAVEERDKCQNEMVQNLMHSHQHILGILYVRVSFMFNLSN
jgi:hypothetical protein